MRQLDNRLSKLEGEMGPRSELAPVFQTNPESGQVISAWVSGSGVIERTEGEDLRIFEARVNRAYACRPGIDQMSDEALQADLDFLRALIKDLSGMADDEFDSAIESEI